MKIPLIWLKDYLDTTKSAAAIAAGFTQIGLMLDKPLGDGKVLDLEHRMDRSDWLSVIGCARDLAAYENLRLKLPKIKVKPGKKPATDQLIPIKVTCPELVHRFNTRVFRGVKVGPSPDWIQERLEAYGIKSVNNIVDITNFVMVEYGQPMHAQDLARLPAPEITIRRARKNEKLTSFLGTELKLDDSMFVLTSGDIPVVLGGIVGGINTGVSESTVDFILDAGNYDQRNIRHTSRTLKIANETVLRYDKYLDPRLTEPAIARATELIGELAGGTYYDNVDWYPTQTESKNSTLRFSRLRLLSGNDIPLSYAKKILVRLGYVITDQTEETLSVEIPYFRTDSEVEDDLIADILRISDYANIPSIPLTSPVPTDITPPIYLFEDRLRDIMSAAGCHEHITGSLVTADDVSGRIILQNALTSEQSALRLSVEETLTQVASTYRKHGSSDTALYEIGKVYRHEGASHAYTGYTEERRLTVVGRTAEQRGHLLATILHELGIAYTLRDHSDTVLIEAGKQKIGYLTQDSFCLFTESLLPLANTYGIVTSEFGHPQSLDLSFSVPEGCSFGDMHRAIMTASPAITSLRVAEKRVGSVLIHLTWPEKTDTAKAKSKIVESLKAMGVLSRSG